MLCRIFIQVNKQNRIKKCRILENISSFFLPQCVPLIFIAVFAERPKAFVEFASPKYAVLESAKLVKITVMRTGNTKIPATVR